MLKVKKRGDGHQHPALDAIEKVLKDEPTKRLNADLPKSLYLKIKKYAVANEMTITDMTKEALLAYMSREKE